MILIAVVYADALPPELRGKDEITLKYACSMLVA